MPRSHAPTVEDTGDGACRRPLRRLLLALAPIVPAGLVLLIASACAGGVEISTGDPAAAEALVELLEATPGGPASFVMPASLDDIPADPENPLTDAKVELGELLFHDTALAVAGLDETQAHTYSCASCHHVDAGFKAGIDQGIGEGGDGFDADRVVIVDFDQPDVQPFASPTALNTAFQDVMLWNGQFGNSAGSINSTVDLAALTTPDTPKVANELGYEGLETQAIAALGVHRLTVEDNDELTSDGYVAMFRAAFPDASTWPTDEQAGLAIAAYERTLLTTEAPFQRWLRGDDEAMTAAELRGALVFFGPAGCSDCHTGPGLSSPPDSTNASELFQSVGFADLDAAERDGPDFLGPMTDADRLGRGGLTGDQSDADTFKIPSLYNLTDTEVFGHGASFSSVEEVVDYFLAAVPQDPSAVLDERFVPRPLTSEQRDDLLVFLTSGLHDPDLGRYAPPGWPDGDVGPG